jgi:predicted SnoaL-like aldol condensation-catalyzing enzyme
MKRIKKFESFTTKYRLPTKVSEDEWKKKSNMYNDEEFKQKEVDFFKKLKEENPSKITDISRLAPGAIIMEFGMVWIHFYKKSDDWYLICVETNRFRFQEVTDGDEYYICDEWDEVLGYLENINFII